MTVVLIIILLLALFVAGIAIRLLDKKSRQFSRTCTTNNPLFQNEGGACGFCGAKPEEKCKA